jgi:acyl-CoA oxidase
MALSLITYIKSPADFRSALGRSDGKVYEDLYDRASRLNPMNGITINADYRIDEAELGSNDSQSIRGKL